MQESCTVDMTGGFVLSAFHGSPRSITEDLLATTSAETLDEALGAHKAAVIAAGHTHLQMLRQHRGTLVVNPGSVGMPFKEYVAGRAPTVLRHAEYATVEAANGHLHVSLHRVALDREALIASVRGSDVPLKDTLLAQYAD
jgi:predicted phosphodiesterase